MALDDCECTEYLTINGVDLQGPAWVITDLSDIDNLQKRGTDRIIPGSAGFISNPRRLAPVVLIFPLTVVGDVNRLGVATPDVRQGLATNIEYLKANVAQYGSASTTAVTAVRHMADGTTDTAQVHVERLEFERFGSIAKDGILEIAVPAGRFA